MGFFSDLFGGQDTTGMKTSIQQNEAVRDQMHAITADSKDQLRSYIPRGMENQRQAYSSMFNLAKQTPQQQLGLIGQGSQGQQAALLGGLQNYENAILGLPTQQLQANPIQMQYAQNMFQNVQRPHFLSQPIRSENIPPMSPLAGMGGY